MEKSERIGSDEEEFSARSYTGSDEEDERGSSYTGSYTSEYSQNDEESSYASDEDSYSRSNSYSASNNDNNEVGDDSFALSENKSTAGHSFVDTVGGDESFLFESRESLFASRRGRKHRIVASNDSIVHNDELADHDTSKQSIFEMLPQPVASTSNGDFDSSPFPDAVEELPQTRLRDSSPRERVSNDEGSFSGSYDSHSGTSYSRSYHSGHEASFSGSEYSGSRSSRGQQDFSGSYASGEEDPHTSGVHNSTDDRQSDCSVSDSISDRDRSYHQDNDASNSDFERIDDQQSNGSFSGSNSERDGMGNFTRDDSFSCPRSDPEQVGNQRSDGSFADSSSSREQIPDQQSGSGSNRELINDGNSFSDSVSDHHESDDENTGDGFSFPKPGREQPDDQSDGNSAESSGSRDSIHNDEQSRGSCTNSSSNRERVDDGSFADSISDHHGGGDQHAGDFPGNGGEQADEQQSDGNSAASNVSSEQIHNDERSRGSCTSSVSNRERIDDGSFSDSVSDHHGNHEQSGGGLSFPRPGREQADDQECDGNSVGSSASRERIRNGELSRHSDTSSSYNRKRIDDGSFSDSFSGHHQSDDQQSSGNSSCFSSDQDKIDDQHSGMDIPQDDPDRTLGRHSTGRCAGSTSDQEEQHNNSSFSGSSSDRERLDDQESNDDCPGSYSNRVQSRGQQSSDICAPSSSHSDQTDERSCDHSFSGSTSDQDNSEGDSHSDCRRMGNHQRRVTTESLHSADQRSKHLADDSRRAFVASDSDSSGRCSGSDTEGTSSNLDFDRGCDSSSSSHRGGSLNDDEAQEEVARSDLLGSRDEDAPFRATKERPVSSTPQEDDSDSSVSNRRKTTSVDENGSFSGSHHTRNSSSQREIYSQTLLEADLKPPNHDAACSLGDRNRNQKVSPHFSNIESSKQQCLFSNPSLASSVSIVDLESVSSSRSCSHRSGFGTSQGDSNSHDDDGDYFSPNNSPKALPVPSDKYQQQPNQSIHSTKMDYLTKSKFEQSDGSLWISSLKVTSAEKHDPKTQPQTSAKINTSNEVSAAPTEASIWLSELEQGSVVHPSEESSSDRSDGSDSESSYSSKSQSNSDEYSQSSSGTPRSESRSSNSTSVRSDDKGEDQRSTYLDYSRSSAAPEQQKNKVSLCNANSAHSRHASWRDESQQDFGGEGDYSERYQSDFGASFGNSGSSSRFADSRHSEDSRFMSQHGSTLNAVQTIPPSPATPSAVTIATDTYESFAAETPIKAQDSLARSEDESFGMDPRTKLYHPSLEASTLTRLTEGREVSSSSSYTKQPIASIGSGDSTHKRKNETWPSDDTTKTFDSLLAAIPTIVPGDDDEVLSTLSAVVSVNGKSASDRKDSTSGEVLSNASRHIAPDAIFIENDINWSKTTRTSLSFETFSSHKRSDNETQSTGTFDPSGAENNGFDTTATPTKQESKQSFGSFQKGDFFESGHISRSTRSSRSNVSRSSLRSTLTSEKDYKSDDDSFTDGGSSQSFETLSRRSIMSGDSFGSRDSKDQMVEERRRKSDSSKSGSSRHENQFPAMQVSVQDVRSVKPSSDQHQDSYGSFGSQGSESSHRDDISVGSFERAERNSFAGDVEKSGVEKEHTESTQIGFAHHEQEIDKSNDSSVEYVSESESKSEAGSVISKPSGMTGASFRETSRHDDEECLRDREPTMPKDITANHAESSEKFLSDRNIDPPASPSQQYSTNPDDSNSSGSDEFWEDTSKYTSGTNSFLDDEFSASSNGEWGTDDNSHHVEDAEDSDKSERIEPQNSNQEELEMSFGDEFVDQASFDVGASAVHGSTEIVSPNDTQSCSDDDFPTVDFDEFDQPPAKVPNDSTSQLSRIPSIRPLTNSSHQASENSNNGDESGSLHVDTHQHLDATANDDFLHESDAQGFPSSTLAKSSSVLSENESSMNVSQLGNSQEQQNGEDDDKSEDEQKSLRLPKPKSYGGYNRDQIGKLSQKYRTLNESEEDYEGGARLQRGKDRNRRALGKSEALLSLAANVHDALVAVEKIQREQAEADLSDSKRKASEDSESEEEFLTPTRLVYAFEVLVGIVLELSDELELLQTFSISKDSSAIDSLSILLSHIDEIDEKFSTLKPILQHYQTDEAIDEELDDFLYGMNLLVDLMCELCNRVATKHQWCAKANTSFITMLELLARDTLEVKCIFDDVDTPEYHLTYKIQDAWEATGHVEEIKTLLVTSDLFMFRQICYEVMISTDQWCPNNNTLMDICGVDDEPQNLAEPKDDETVSPAPEPALQILEKIHGEPLPRSPSLSSVIRRILPASAITDPLVSENFARIRNTVRNPLGLPPSSLVSITSIAESIDDPEALGVAGIGKSTLAAMVANHDDVRRFFSDGIAWIYVGETELTYNRYIQCLQDLLAQLEVDEEEEPLFPELLHCPGESFAVRRRREEGFMIYLRETMVEFLRNRNVLVILDDVCFEPDLDWFDFAPAQSPDQPDDDDDGCCAMLVTSRRRTLLPPADTVEIDMMEQSEARSLLIRESGDLADVLASIEPNEVSAVILECACHPLTIKSVGRWLNLKHASAIVAGEESTEMIKDNVFESLEKILQAGEEDHDMLYSTLHMSLSPTINGHPTTIIKFCFAAFVRVFCEREYISDFALADSTPIVPLTTTILLYESLLSLEEDALRNEGSLFYTKKDEAASLIPEALSALGVFKVIITSTEGEDESDNEDEVEEEKYIQIMHRIQQEYGEYLYDDDETLTDLMRDGEKKWNQAFSYAMLQKDIEWDAEAPDASVDYALEMLPSHLMRGGLLAETSELLCDERFAKGRLFALGRENGTRRQIKDCETLFDLLVEERSKNKKRTDVRGTIRSAYEILGGLLKMDEEEYIEEEGSPEAVEVGRCHFELGFSLAEKRCWEGAIYHWESSQEFLVSSLGMVELVAGILFNVGVVYSELHEYDQALSSLKQCLRIRGAIHGEEHILYAQTIQKIGDIFLAMSDYHEAMESYNWALDVMHIEPSHHRISIGDILEQMGNIHYSKGEIKASLQSYQDGLRSKQVDLGEDHPELSSLYHHIGNCLSNLGKTDEAVAHLEEAVRLKKLDSDGGYERDSDVLTIQGILDNLNGMPHEGLRSYELALQILVTKVSHRKEKVASLLHLIGCVYLMSGEHKKSMKLFEESLHARRKVLGFVHLDVASTLFNMAFLHQTRNRLDKALKCLEEALKIRQLRLPNSEKVAVTHEKIGNLARGIGKTKKAENAFEEALVIRKRIHGNNHEAVATVLQELGDLMDDLGNYEDAMRHYVEALEIRESRLGPDDLAVAETYYSMGFTLQNNGALDRALQCLEESLSIRKFQLGDDAKEVGDTLNMMGFLQAKRGELDDALSLLWDALRIRKLQDDHIKVSETLNNIGNVHREKQEFDLSLECYEECARIRRAELGDSSEKVADALIAIGNVQSDMDFTEDAMDSYKEGKL